MPENIEFVLLVLNVIVRWGRHLRDTIVRRSTEPGFPFIAAGFGTGKLSAIRAHIERGLRRAIALDNVLRARAAAKRDLKPVPRRLSVQEQLERDQALADAPPKPPAPKRPRRPRPAMPPGWDDPELFMPTVEELERLIRR